MGEMNGKTYKMLTVCRHLYFGAVKDTYGHHNHIRLECVAVSTYYWTNLRFAELTVGGWCKVFPANGWFGEIIGKFCN